VPPPTLTVKHHRTKYQVRAAHRVHDGDLDEFIKAYLMKRALGKL
jgi:protein subunit release factor B